MIEKNRGVEQMDKEITIAVQSETMKEIEAAAREKDMGAENMIRLILNEWALKQKLVNSLAEMKKDR